MPAGFSFAVNKIILIILKLEVYKILRQCDNYSRLNLICIALK